MKGGAKGIRVQCSGRLGGAEMSRSEFYREGRVPLHTLRADIDYGFYEARTTFGRIGVKVWIYKGEAPTRPGRARGGRGRAAGGPPAPGPADRERTQPQFVPTRKRQGEVEGARDDVVDVHHAGVHLARQSHRLVPVSGPHASGQPQPGIVRLLDRLGESRTFITGKVGPKVSSRMHVMPWSTSTSTSARKQSAVAGSHDLPPTSLLAPLLTASSTWPDTMAVVARWSSTRPRRNSRAWRPCPGATATFGHHLADELVVHRLLDVHPLYRYADLARVGEGAKYRAIGGRSISASAQTIIASLPPSSRLHGTSRCAAATAMRRPVLTNR